MAPSSSNLPESIDEINIELSKQESLLAQMHAEMNAGFISKKSEEQLWEVQRLITQLKRKLKIFEKKIEENVEDIVDGESSHQLPSSTSIPNTAEITHDFNHPVLNDDFVGTAVLQASLSELKMSPKSDIPNDDSSEILVHESGMLVLPESHPEYWTLIRLQVENEELMKWKNSLKIKINVERSEALRLKKMLVSKDQSSTYVYDSIIEESDHEKVVDHFIKENSLLEHKRNMLINEIFEVSKELIKFKIELTMKSV